MVDFQWQERYGFQDLLHIMALLRSPEGCPWDREQTHESIRRNFLEEACEAVEAIDGRNAQGLCEELGDVLLQVVFHAQLEAEKGGFTMDDVVDGVCKKLVYRHPHVFGDAQASSGQEALDRWDAMKRKEKGQSSAADAVDAVAKTLPALWRADKTLSRAAKAGFDWPSRDGALDKLSEEVGELRQAVADGAAADAPHGVREEVGDVLLAAAKVARDHGVDPEEALHRACEKYARRFRLTEAQAGDKPLSECSQEELASLWAKAKQALS